jgi:hypothetical protein
MVKVKQTNSTAGSRHRDFENGKGGIHRERMAKYFQTATGVWIIITSLDDEEL